MITVVADILDYKKQNVVMISLHSFTRQLRTSSQVRPWDIGLLYHEPNALTSFLLKSLRDKGTICVGDNEPYDLRNSCPSSVSIHAVPRGIDYVEIEICNDGLADSAGIQKWSSLLTDLLRDYLTQRKSQ